MSSCFSGGGGRPYALDLELVKSPSPLSRSSHSSHSSSPPKSTLSDTTTSSVPLAISTKKPRTPRKRPNQTYTEATALLAMIYPNIFSTKNLRKHCKVSASKHPFLDTSELLPPFLTSLPDAGFLPHTIQLIGPEKPNSQVQVLKYPLSTARSSASSPASSSSSSSWSPTTEPNSIEGTGDEFDAESILDEEIGEGIDSIMGNLRCEEDTPSSNDLNLTNPFLGHLCGSFGFPMNMTTALRDVGNGDWWSSFLTVEMQNIVPNLKKSITKKKKKKKKVVVEKLPNLTNHNSSKKIPDKSPSSSSSTTTSSSSSSMATAGCLKPVLNLTLNYDGVMRDWTGHGRGSPFSEVADSVSPFDIIAKLSDLDLLSEVAGSGGMRDASVLRYKEKRRSRLFSKKIRYQVKKVNTKVKPRGGGEDGQRN